MRRDMGKCVIERPRGNSRAPSRKARSFGKIVLTEDGYEYFGETKLPMAMNGRAHGWDSKQFSDVLGPLQNYLQSSCGRPWDDVYSEIKKTLGHSGWAVEHIVRDHITVAVNTWRGISGKVWDDAENGPETVSSSYRTHFYVEPETGILRASPPRESYHASRSTYRNRFVQPPVESAYVTLSPTSEYRWIKGIWYYQEYAREEQRVFDREDKHGNKYYRDVIVTTIKHKKQLNKKELRDFRAARHHVSVVRKEPEVVRRVTVTKQDGQIMATVQKT